MSEERRVLLAAFGLAAGLVAIAAVHAMSPAHIQQKSDAQARPMQVPELTLPTLSSRS